MEKLLNQKRKNLLREFDNAEKGKSVVGVGKASKFKDQSEAISRFQRGIYKLIEEKSGNTIYSDLNKEYGAISSLDPLIKNFQLGTRQAESVRPGTVLLPLRPL